MAEFAPVTTLADLDSLAVEDVVDGYRDGRADAPEPGNNRSRSYWHGWNVGQMDIGRRPVPPEHRALVAASIARERQQRSAS